MSVRSEKSASQMPASEQMSAAIAEAMPADSHLHEGSNYSTASADNPLSRTVVVSLRASLNELCLKADRGKWTPSAEALKSIFQSKKYTALDGSAEAQGDLKSVVLHDMTVTHVKSTFPVSLGARITGVDDSTYSSTGEAFSTILLPHAESSTAKKLQSDDVSLAYEFSKKFPGYTSEENADKLQMGEISMMPEGLVKISSGLYESILPLVKTQVESQIKVRDFSRCNVAMQPAEYASWNDARAELMVEKKRPLKAQLAAELAAAPSDEARDEITAAFDAREKAIEHDLDHSPMDVHLTLDVSYNFLSK